MHVVYSIVMGAIAGWIASRIVIDSSSGLVLNAVLGVIGAVVGGFISDKLGWGGLHSGGMLWYLFVSVIGAIVVLVAYRAISRSA